MPRFSIWMPTLNRPQFIVHAIDAIVLQDFTDWELIIKDGGTSVERLIPKDPRIKYEHMPGVSFLDRCTKLVAEAGDGIRNFQADDDIMLPGTLSHIDSIIGDAMWGFGRINMGPGYQLHGGWSGYEALTYGNCVPFPAAFWTKAAENIVGLIDTSLCCCDYEYWLKLGARFKPFLTERVLVNYRMHPGQDSVLQSQRVADEAAMLSSRAQNGYYTPAIQVPKKV